MCKLSASNFQPVDGLVDETKILYLVHDHFLIQNNKINYLYQPVVGLTVYDRSLILAPEIIVLSGGTNCILYNQRMIKDLSNNSKTDGENIGSLLYFPSKTSELVFMNKNTGDVFFYNLITDDSLEIPSSKSVKDLMDKNLIYPLVNCSGEYFDNYSIRFDKSKIYISVFEEGNDNSITIKDINNQTKSC